MSSTIDDTARDYLLIRYVLVATLALYSYEYICTIGEEVRLVWPTRTSMVKALFFANRYLPFSFILAGIYMYILNSDATACRRLLFIEGMLSATGVIFAEVVLALRAYVIWDRTPKLLGVLVVLMLGGTVGGYYGTAHFFTTAVVSETQFFKTGCLVEYKVRTTEAVSYGIISLYEAFILILMLIKMFHVRRATSTLMRIVYGDSVFYCVSVLLITVGNLILLKSASETLCHLLLLPQAAMHNILCNRLILRLRSANLALTEQGFLSIHVSEPNATFLLRQLQNRGSTAEGAST